MQQGRGVLGRVDSALADPVLEGPVTPSIAPLERFVAPPHLDGSQGTHRCKTGCQIDVAKDQTALDWWVTRASSTEATARMRRSASEKLLNWAVFARGKAVSSLDDDDFVAFARFLARPEPIHLWIGYTRRRDLAAWRPFSKPLTPKARDQVLRNVSSLISWLAKQGYAQLHFAYGHKVAREGLATVAVKGAERPVRPAAPISVAEWHWIRQLLDRAYPAPDLAVQRAFVELLYYGNLFVEEVAKLEVRDCEAPNRFAPGWSIRVPSRSWSRGGNKVFAPPPLSDTLGRWIGQHEAPRQGYVTLRIRDSTQTLFDADGMTVSYKARQVLRLAASLALEHGDVANGLSLRDRSLISLRGAFAAHQLRKPVDRGAIELTGHPFKFGMDVAERRLPVWDWSRAKHLWTEDALTVRHT